MSETFSKGFWAAAFWIPVAYAILRYGAVERTDWYLCLAVLGIATLLYHVRAPLAAVAPPPDRLLLWTLVALPAYVLWQILPLPVGLLQLLSPERAEIASALDRIGLHQSFVPVSVAPSETLFQLSCIAGCTLLFLAARNLVWRWPERSWRLAFPLIVVASAEAVLGLVQFFADPDTAPHGTYVNHNHFAGLLEMALPFAVAYPFAAMRVNAWLKAGLGLAAAALILAAIGHSLSRSGSSVALGALALMAVVAVGKNRGQARAIIAIAAAGAILSLSLLFPPDRLIDRFGQLSDIRPQIWSDTTRLIAAFPVVGCGLGGFEPAFHQYRTAALEVRIDYAHNDYLQTLAELGIVGFGIALILCGALLVETVRAVRHSSQLPLALASAGALAAMAAHSFTDFNLHIPANALVLAWIAGIASGLSVSSKRNICNS